MVFSVHVPYIGGYNLLISNRLNKRLTGLAKKKYYGNKYLFDLINIFSYQDLLQSFYVYLLDSQEEKSDDLIISDFRQFIIWSIRAAKKRWGSAELINYSDLYIKRNVGEEDLSKEELIDNYIYNHSYKRGEREPDLFEDSYYRGGVLNKDLLLKDLHREMLKRDRYVCIYNPNSNNKYFCGNPLAIPSIANRLQSGMEIFDDYDRHGRVQEKT